MTAPEKVIPSGHPGRINAIHHLANRLNLSPIAAGRTTIYAEIIADSPEDLGDMLHDLHDYWEWDRDSDELVHDLGYGIRLAIDVRAIDDADVATMLHKHRAAF